ALPLWGIYDAMIEPEQADRFLTVRLAALLPIFAIWAVLWHRRFGERHAELLAVALCTVPQVVVAWMLPNVDHGFPGYLLGFSLGVYGSAFLLVGRMWVTCWLVGITVGATTVSFLLQADGVSSFELTTTIFYLGTASLLAFVGRSYRIHLERRGR